MANSTKNPFVAVVDNEEGQQPEGEVSDEQFEQDVTTLGEAAASAFGDNLEGIHGAQETLDGTEYLKVRFVGMSMDSLDDEIGLGDELTFIVRARCVGEGTDLAKTDGHKRRFVKMDVQSVTIKDA